MSRIRRMTSPESTATRQLQILTAALKELRSGDIDVPAFSAHAQQHGALFAALPPRYRDVFMQLLTRLESAMAFTEESCSFSQSGLLDHFDVWLQKAGAQLAPDTLS